MKIDFIDPYFTKQTQLPPSWIRKDIIDPYKFSDFDWWEQYGKRIEDYRIGDYYDSKVIDIEEDNKMDKLTQDYHKIHNTAEKSRAVSIGAIDNSGRLTKEGQELLTEIFYDSPTIQEIFFEIATEIYNTRKDNNDHKNKSNKSNK